MPYTLSISFPGINLLHSSPPYLFIPLLDLSLHTFDHVVLTSFLLTKSYPLFMPPFKFFLFYKMVLKYFSPIFTLSFSRLALWVCLTNFKINYSLPYERYINIEASLLEFYHFTMSVITGTCLSEFVCVCVTGNSNKIQIRAGKRWNGTFQLCKGLYCLFIFYSLCFFVTYFNGRDVSLCFF